MLILDCGTCQILALVKPQLFMSPVTQCCMCNFWVSDVHDKPPKFNITLRWQKHFKKDYNKVT